MSAVMLLCADHPLPLYDSGVCRTGANSCMGHTVTAETSAFSVRAHSYYRDAVDELELPLKPWQYEVSLAATPEDGAQLRTYLAQNLASGETVELWNLWVGADRQRNMPRFRGRLADLDEQTLEQFCCPPLPWPGAPWQCRMTIEI